jgi:hypothetical protein
MLSQTSGGTPRSRTGGACEAPPHKDENRLADQFLSWIYALYPHSRAVGYCDKINTQTSKETKSIGSTNLFGYVVKETYKKEKADDSPPDLGIT